MTDGEEGARGPRHASGLIGHGSAEQLLLDCCSTGRLHHAWLFGGPQGIGKATLAYRFARFLLTGEQTASMFGDAPRGLQVEPSHPVFRRVAARSHPDLLTVQRSAGTNGKLRSEIVVGDIRQVGEFLRKTPAEGGWRVVVLDSADELNPNASNALLKLLEEPPPSSLLLLVSHNPARLLPTIRSRCRRIMLRSLPVEDTVRVILSERPDMAEEQARLLAELAEGRPGIALGLAEEGGIDLFRALLSLLEGLPNLDVAMLHAKAEKMAQGGGRSFEVFTALLSWWLVRFMRLSTVDRDGFREIVPGERALVARLAAGAPLDRWCEVWEKIAHLVARTDGLNLDRRQVFLDIFFGLQGTFRQPAGASA